MNTDFSDFTYSVRMDYFRLCHVCSDCVLLCHTHGLKAQKFEAQGKRSGTLANE